MYQGGSSKIYVWETPRDDRMDLEDGSIWPHHNPWKWSDVLWPNSGDGPPQSWFKCQWKSCNRHDTELFCHGKSWEKSDRKQWEREEITCSKGPEAGIWPLAAVRTRPLHSGVRALPTELPGRHPSWVFLLWWNKRIWANSFSVWEQKKNCRQQFKNRLKIPRCLLWCGNCRIKFWRSSHTLTVLYVMDICHVRSVALLPLHHS